MLVSTENKLAAGNVGLEDVVEDITTGGYSWGVLYDDAADTLWCLVGQSLQARAKDGKLIRSFTPLDLGDNVYSISLFNETTIMIEGAAPKLPEDAPPGVVAAKPVPVVDKDKLVQYGINDSCIEEITDDSGVVTGCAIKPKIALELARGVSRWSGAVINKAIPLPAFEAEVTKSGNTLITAWKLSGQQLMASGGDPGRIKIIKILPGYSAGSYEYAVNGDGKIDFRDGSYYVSFDGGATAYTGTIDESAGYSLVLILEDGGRFDLDGDGDGNVLDPPAIVGESGEEYMSQPDESWGGGCDAVPHGTALFSAAVLFCLLKFDERRREGWLE